MQLLLQHQQASIFELIKKVLNADKHCFCEKPMTNTYEEALEISEILAKKPHLKFQVGHSERFHEVLNELHLPLSKKNILRLDRLAPFKGRGDDVGIVQDLMIHDFDLISYFWGTAPQSLEAYGKKFLVTNGIMLLAPFTLMMVAEQF